MKHPDKELLGQFPDGHFHDGQLPKEISRRQFLEGQFLERAFLLTDIFSDRQFLNDISPNGKFSEGHLPESLCMFCGNTKMTDMN